MSILTLSEVLSFGSLCPVCHRAYTIDIDLGETYLDVGAVTALTLAGHTLSHLRCTACTPKRSSRRYLVRGPD